MVGDFLEIVKYISWIKVLTGGKYLKIINHPETFIWYRRVLDVTRCNLEAKEIPWFIEENSLKDKVVEIKKFKEKSN